MVKRVLVVDDQETMQDLLVQVLELEGYETCIAADGREGVRKLYDYRPDLVITDYAMPLMDGSEFSRIVRMACDAPIIMLTALDIRFHDMFDRELYDDFVLKPVEIDDLSTRINSLINGQRTKGQAKLFSLPPLQTVQ